MTDLSLNPQLGARLRGLQLAWGHDTPSETLAIIFDAIIYKWSITLPSNNDISVDVVNKVRLRTRHQEYFARMSQLTGCSVPELARSALIQWLCFPPQEQNAPHSTRMLPETTQMSHKTTRMLPSKTKKPSKKAKPVEQVTTIAPIESHLPLETIQSDETEATTQEKPATTGRAAMSNLFKK